MFLSKISPNVGVHSLTGARLNQDDYLFAIKNWKNIFLLLLGGVLNVRRCPRNSCPELSFGVFFPNYLSSSLAQYVGCLVLVVGARFGNTNKLVRFVDTFFGGQIEGCSICEAPSKSLHLLGYDQYNKN